MATIKKYTNKDGSTLWKFRTYLGTDQTTGKQKFTNRQGFKTKKEAQLALARLQSGIEQTTTRGNISTFEDVYNLWYPSYKLSVKESSAWKTKRLFDNTILPAFGNKRLNKITIAYCQKIANKWFAEYSRGSMYYNYASKVLDYAITLELIDKNPMKAILKPKQKASDKDPNSNFYDKDELQHFLSCAKQMQTMKWHVFFTLLAYTGMRKGEALALEWSDINSSDKILNVNRTLTVGQNNKQIVQTPKTNKGYREITLNDGTIKLLKQWRLEQKKEMLAFGFNTIKPHQLVFSKLTDNGYLSLSKPTNVIQRIYERFDIKHRITVHGFRHTHCSLLFEAGASIKEVQDRLGHSDIKTTMNIYAHVTKKAKTDTAEKFARFINS